MTSGPWELGRLRLLREVGLRGSIAAAAREAGLTPSAVSQQIAALERDVALQLLQRSPRGVTLTDAGRALAARATQVLDVLAAAQADLDRLGGAVAGRVAIASVPSAAISLVSHAVTWVERSHPDVTVRVVAAEPTEALRHLLAGEVDLAVVDEYDYVPLSLPDWVVTRPLLAEPLVLVRAESETHPVRGLGELAEAPWVMPPSDAACGLAVRSACRAVGFEPDVRWTSDDMVVLCTAVAHGHGVAVLPRLSVPTAVPGVRTDALATPPLERRLTAVSRSGTLARQAVGVVWDALGGVAESALSAELGSTVDDVAPV